MIDFTYSPRFYCPAHAVKLLSRRTPTAYAMFTSFTIQYSNPHVRQFGGPRCAEHGCYARPS